jgi:hypothetical protein
VGEQSLIRGKTSAFRASSQNAAIKVQPTPYFYFNNILHYEIIYRILKN